MTSTQTDDLLPSNRQQAQHYTKPTLDMAQTDKVTLCNRQNVLEGITFTSVNDV